MEWNNPSDPDERRGLFASLSAKEIGDLVNEAIENNEQSPPWVIQAAIHGGTEWKEAKEWYELLNGNS